MKRLLIGMTAMALALGLTACQTAKEEEQSIAGGTYIGEEEGFGGEFTITLNEDGTFTFYEGLLSSYQGTGTWTLENEVLTLKDTRSVQEAQYHFQVEEDALVFLAEDSDAFPYVEVHDGERFTRSAAGEVSGEG